MASKSITEASSLTQMYEQVSDQTEVDDADMEALETYKKTIKSHKQAIKKCKDAIKQTRQNIHKSLSTFEELYRTLYTIYKEYYGKGLSEDFILPLWLQEFQTDYLTQRYNINMQMFKSTLTKSVFDQFIDRCIEIYEDDKYEDVPPVLFALKDLCKYFHSDVREVSVYVGGKIEFSFDEEKPVIYDYDKYITTAGRYETIKTKLKVGLDYFTNDFSKYHVNDDTNWDPIGITHIDTVVFSVKSTKSVAHKTEKKLRRK